MASAALCAHQPKRLDAPYMFLALRSTSSLPAAVPAVCAFLTFAAVLLRQEYRTCMDQALRLARKGRRKNRSRARAIRFLSSGVLGWK